MPKRFALFAAVLGCAYAQGNGSPTFTRTTSFSPTGLSSSETAQVNVLNIATASNAANATAPSCTGSVTFANAAGTAIGNGVSFTTTGSKIFTTQLTFAQLGATGNRGEFVASVHVTTTPSSKAPCQLVFSLETFDNATGATHIYLGNASAGTAPGLGLGH